MKKGRSIKDTKPYILNQKPQPPLQYQRGWTEFYKLKFKLTPDVLIPRPETEILVDEAINFANRESNIVYRKDISESPINNKRQPITIVDIGTGSGCIAISIAKNLPNSKIFAVDISPKALKIAETNTKFHKVENRVLLLQSDLLSIFIPKIPSPRPFGERARVRGIQTEKLTTDQPETDNRKQRTDNRIPTIDILVTNLPYIPTARLLLIDPMVTEFEPRIALDGGRDGFDLYRKLFQQITLLNYSPIFSLPLREWTPKILIAEIDEEQGEVALQEAKKYFPNAKSEIKQDLHKKDRILIINF